MAVEIVPDSSCADCGAAEAKFKFIFAICVYENPESICEACAPQYHSADLEEKSR